MLQVSAAPAVESKSSRRFMKCLFDRQAFSTAVVALVLTGWSIVGGYA